MKGFCVIIRRPPYGSADAAEGLRHALGGAMEDGFGTSVLLLDSGVHAAVKGQDVTGTPFQEIGSGLGDCIDMGVAVYADRGSMMEQGIMPGDLMDGVKVAGGPEVADVLGRSDVTLIF